MSCVACKMHIIPLVVCVAGKNFLCLFWSAVTLYNFSKRIKNFVKDAFGSLAWIRACEDVSCYVDWVGFCWLHCAKKTANANCLFNCPRIWYFTAPVCWCTCPGDNEFICFFHGRVDIYMSWLRNFMPSQSLKL